MKRLFILPLLILPLLCQSQETAQYRFTEQMYDFGTIEESAGPVTHEFRFVNAGDDSLRIVSVDASCGCTTPSWTRTALAPGDSGMIQAQYNPVNRPGMFNKSLTVTFDQGTEPVQLFIRGKVNPTPGTADEEFPHKIGGIRLKYRTFNMGKVFTTKEPTEKSFEIYNDSDSVISFSGEVLKPAFVEVRFEPSEIAPGETARLIVSYDARKKNDLGFSSDDLTFFTSEGEGASRKSVNLYATIEEYFPPMDEEALKKAPHLAIKTPLHDFDKLKENAQVTTSFTLINSGQSTLEIRQVKGNCDCVTAEVDRKSLEPGETAEVKVTFDATGRKGNQQKSITVYSNDPMAPAQRMTIRAWVETED